MENGERKKAISHYGQVKEWNWLINLILLALLLTTKEKVVLVVSWFWFLVWICSQFALPFASSCSWKRNRKPTRARRDGDDNHHHHYYFPHYFLSFCFLGCFPRFFKIKRFPFSVFFCFLGFSLLLFLSQHPSGVCTNQTNTEREG